MPVQKTHRTRTSACPKRFTGQGLMPVPNDSLDKDQFLCQRLTRKVSVPVPKSHTKRISACPKTLTGQGSVPVPKDSLDKDQRLSQKTHWTKISACPLNNNNNSKNRLLGQGPMRDPDQSMTLAIRALTLQIPASVSCPQKALPLPIKPCQAFGSADIKKQGN